MAKKEMFLSDAERLYVNEQCTMAEIASRLRLGEKTVRNWKQEYGWDLKRKNYLAERASFHQELYQFARNLMKNIEKDMADGVKVDPGRMYAFTKVLPQFLKIKNYEDAIGAEAEASANAKELTPDIVKMIEKEVLGIDRE